MFQNQFYNSLTCNRENDTRATDKAAQSGVGPYNRSVLGPELSRKNTPHFTATRHTPISTPPPWLQPAS